MSDVITPGPEDLIRYLLGRVPADEAARLDELSITNDGFADALEAAEMDLIDSYVNGGLSAGDRDKFEQKYMRSRDQRDRIIFANALQEYAASHLSATPVENTPSGFFEWTGRLFQFGLAAAALLLAVAGGWFFISRIAQNGNETAAVHESPVTPITSVPSEIPTISPGNTHAEMPKNEVQQRETVKPEVQPREKPLTAQPPRIVAVVLSPQLRSSGEPKKVEVPAGTDLLSTRLELESGGFKSYRAVLNELSSNRLVWQSNTVKPTGPANARVCAVSIPARLLNSATYILTVSGISESGTAEIVGDYSFTVVR
jgi:hypothetical protein